MSYNYPPEHTPEFNGQENFEDAFYPCSPESEPSDPFMGYCQEVSPEIDPSSSHAGARTSLPTARPSKGSRRKRGMPSAEPPDIRKGSSSRHFRNSPVPGVSISPSTASEPDWKSFLHLSVGHDSPEMGSLRDSSSWETSGLAIVQTPSPYHPRSPQMPTNWRTFSSVAFSPLPRHSLTLSRQESYQIPGSPLTRNDDYEYQDSEAYSEGVPNEHVSSADYAAQSALFSPSYHPNRIYEEDLVDKRFRTHGEDRSPAIHEPYEGMTSPLVVESPPDNSPCQTPQRRPSTFPKLKLTSPSPSPSADSSSSRRSTSKHERKPEAKPSKKHSSKGSSAIKPVPIASRSFVAVNSAQANQRHGTYSASNDEKVDWQQEADERAAQDRFLVEKRNKGYSYKEIRKMGNFSQAESTLRGRYRTLTKEKNKRVRSPEWTDHDLELLDESVQRFCKGKDPHATKIAWGQIAHDMVKRGCSYPFGNATCHRVWDARNNKDYLEDGEYVGD